jgi:hypothetical protein
MSNEVHIVKPEDAEDADYVICRRLTSPLLERDNWIDLCSRCGEAIQFRPNSPKRPPKICDPCARPLLEGEAAKGELHVQITAKTAAAVANYMARKKAN